MEGRVVGEMQREEEEGGRGDVPTKVATKGPSNT